MENDINNESPIDLITVENDFDGFDYDDDICENFEATESIKKVLEIDKINDFMDNMDYMWFQEYLDELEDEDKIEALEYVKNNFPEFMEDEEWNLFEPMKWNTSIEKDSKNQSSNKVSFDKRDIQNELGDALLESYKNAA